MAVVSQHLQVIVYCYPLTPQVLKCCPLRDFGRKQFYCQMSCDLEVTNKSMHCWEEISRYMTKERCVNAADEQLKNFLQNQLFHLLQVGRFHKSVQGVNAGHTHAFAFLLDVQVLPCLQQIKRIPKLGHLALAGSTSTLSNDEGSNFFCHSTIHFPQIRMFSFLHREYITYKKAVYEIKCI